MQRSLALLALALALAALVAAQRQPQTFVFNRNTDWYVGKSPYSAAELIGAGPIKTTGTTTHSRPKAT